MKCKDGGSYSYKKQKYRRLEIEKNIFFSYFISEIPNFSYMYFFRNAQWNTLLIYFFIDVFQKRKIVLFLTKIDCTSQNNCFNFLLNNIPIVN